MAPEIPKEKPAYAGPRVAPERREKEPELLESVVVIPVKNESIENVVNAVESVAAQARAASKTDVIRGVVVVINNRPDAPQEVRAANMNVYTVLQALRHGINVSIPGEKDLTKSIRNIQDSGIRIEIIDSFSEGHAHPEGNVGHARKVGSEHALTMVRSDDAAIISTDADTFLGTDALATVREVFGTEEVDAMPLQFKYHTDKLDPESRRAFERHEFFWALRANVIAAYHHVKTLKKKKQPFVSSKEVKDSQVSTDAVWLSGAGTAVRAGAYRKSGGYRTIGAEEDTLLAADVIKAGGTVKDITGKYPPLVFFTQPRISDRTAKGFGHTIGRWAKEGPIGDITVADPRSDIDLEAFYRSVDSLHELQRAQVPSADLRAAFQTLCLKKYKLSAENEGTLWNIFAAWNAVPSSEEHFTFLSQAGKIFMGRFPEISVSAMATELENLVAEYSAEEQKLDADSKGRSLPIDTWKWKEFNPWITKGLSEMNLPLDDPEMGLIIRSTIAMVYFNSLVSVATNYQYLWAGQILKDTPVEEISISRRLKRGLKEIVFAQPETFSKYQRMEMCHVVLRILEDCKRRIGERLSADTKENLNFNIEEWRTDYTKAAQEYREAAAEDLLKGREK